MGWIHRIQMRLDKKYNERNRNQSLYLEHRCASFEQMLRGDITRAEHDKNIREYAKRYLNK